MTSLSSRAEYSGKASSLFPHQCQPPGRTDDGQHGGEAQWIRSSDRSAGLDAPPCGNSHCGAEQPAAAGVCGERLRSTVQSRGSVSRLIDTKHTHTHVCVCEYVYFFACVCALLTVWTCLSVYVQLLCCVLILNANVCLLLSLFPYLFNISGRNCSKHDVILKQSRLRVQLS